MGPINSELFCEAHPKTELPIQHVKTCTVRICGCAPMHLVTVNDGHNAKDKAAKEGGEDGQHQIVLWLALSIDNPGW